MVPSLDRRLLAAALFVWFVVGIVALVIGPPLGHDESAFAILARGDGPPWLYRSRGVVAVAEIGTALGGSDLALRALFVPLSACVVLAVYAVGRAAFGSRTGAWAAAVIAGAHPMVLRNAEILGDLPAAASVLAGIALLISELQRPDGPRWRLVGVAPAFAAAFYFRHGTAPVIAVISAGAVAIWWRSLLEQPVRVLAMVVCFAALFAPHLLHSIEETGTWRGVLDVSRHMPRRAYVGEGLVTYLTSNPFTYYGVLVAPVMVAGLATSWRHGRAAWFLAIIAVGQIVAIGLQSHGQPRYVFVAVALLVVLGVRGLEPLARPRVALALVALGLLGAVIAVVPLNLHVARLRAPYVAAAEAIRADAAGGPCVVTARIVPQLMWYSHCATYLIPKSGALPPLLPGFENYVVSVPGHVLDLESTAASLHRTLQPIPTGDSRAKVGRLR